MNRKMESRRFLAGILQNFLKVKGSVCWNACQGALRLYTWGALQPGGCSSPLSINLVSVFSDSSRVCSAHWGACPKVHIVAFYYCGLVKNISGLCPQFHNPLNFQKDRCIFVMLMNDPRCALDSRWGPVTRKANHLIRELVETSPTTREEREGKLEFSHIANDFISHGHIVKHQ